MTITKDPRAISAVGRFLARSPKFEDPKVSSLNNGIILSLMASLSTRSNTPGTIIPIPSSWKLLIIFIFYFNNVLELTSMQCIFSIEKNNGEHLYKYNGLKLDIMKRTSFILLRLSHNRLTTARKIIMKIKIRQSDSICTE